MDALTVHIGSDMVPIYTVEKPGFVRMAKIINHIVAPTPRYFAEVELSNFTTKDKRKLQSNKRNDCFTPPQNISGLAERCRAAHVPDCSFYFIDADRKSNSFTSLMITQGTE